MQFTRIISFLAFFLTLGALTIASPAPAGFELEARTSNKGGDQTTAILNVLAPLKTTASVTLTEIKSVVGHKNATINVVEPILLALVSEIGKVGISLHGFGSVSLGNSTNGTAIAQELGDIIAEIVSVVELVESDLEVVLSVSLSGLISSIDLALFSLLSTIEGLLSTVLSIVVSLLVSLFGINSGTFLGLGLTLCAKIL